MFHIAIDETGILAKIRLEAQQKIAKEMESSINQQIRAYFATNKDAVLNYQNGVGTDIINGVVDRVVGTNPVLQVGVKPYILHLNPT